MKKCAIVLFLSGLGWTALSDVGISQVVVSQRWPFSPLIDVRYTVSGIADDPVDVSSVVAYSGETSLGEVPESAICGARHGLVADGTYRFTIDPAKCAFAEAGAIPALSIALDVTVSGRTDHDDVLYKIITLSGEFPVKDVTVRNILDGRYGTYETDPTWIQPEVKAQHTHPILFVTGFTNDMTYATDKLVLRRIPSGTYTVGKTGGGIARHTVTLGKDFWIGIFEVTQKQWFNAYGATISCGFPGDCRPVQLNVSYDMIRGYSGDNPDYAWPTGREVRPSSFMGALRQKTGLAFDLPTHAEWLVAASAGAYDATCYDGSTPSTSTKAESAWYLGRNAQNAESTGNPLGGTSNVGQYRANAYGLYDVLGNVRELVLDWFGEEIAQDAVRTNPEGPLTGTQRMSCGGAHGQSLAGGSLLTSHSGINPGDGNANVGFRVAIR